MNALLQRSVGLAAALPTARAPASQTLPNDADPTTASGSFVAMLSAADATPVDDTEEGVGKPTMGALVNEPDEPGNQVDANRDAASAAMPTGVVPLLPAPTEPFDPALLLAQGALSSQPMAPASTLAPSSSATPAQSVAATAVTKDAQGASRSATAEQFGSPAQRLASRSTGPAVQPAVQQIVDSSVPTSAAAAAAASTLTPTSATQSFKLPATGSKPLDPSHASAAWTPPAQAAGRSAAVPAATAVGPDPAARFAPTPVNVQDAIGISATTLSTDAAASELVAVADKELQLARALNNLMPSAANELQPARGEGAVLAGTAQVVKPLVVSGGERAEGPSVTGLDRHVAKPNSDEAVPPLSAAVRPARQLPPAAPSGLDAVEVRQMQHGRATDSAPFLTDLLLLAGRAGRDEERPNKGDSSAASGLFALSTALGAASADSATSGSTAKAAGLHAAAVERIIDQVSWWLAQKSGSADFSIDMPDGQALSVSVQVRGNEAQVVFRSDQPELRQLIGQAMPQLKESFGQEGLLLANASVGAHGSASPGQRWPGHRHCRISRPSVHGPPLTGRASRSTPRWLRSPGAARRSVLTAARSTCTSDCNDQKSGVFLLLFRGLTAVRVSNNPMHRQFADRPLGHPAVHIALS